MTVLEMPGKQLALDADGHLVNRAEWTPELANELAHAEGIRELTDAHWKVINYMRKVFDAEGDAPSIRRLTRESGIETKLLYTLFPKGPAKKAAKIAGLPKPKGCI